MRIRSSIIGYSPTTTLKVHFIACRAARAIAAATVTIQLVCPLHLLTFHVALNSAQINIVLYSLYLPALRIMDMFTLCLLSAVCLHLMDTLTLCILSAVCLHLNTANKLTCSFVKIGERNRENTEQIKKKRKQSKQAKPHVALFSEPNYTLTKLNLEQSISF